MRRRRQRQQQAPYYTSLFFLLVLYTVPVLIPVSNGYTNNVLRSSKVSRSKTVNHSQRSCRLSSTTFLKVSTVSNTGDGYFDSGSKEGDIGSSDSVQHQQSSTAVAASTTASFASPVSNNNYEPRKNVKDEPSKKPRTLYEILGANKNDTRDQIKRKYLTLAKQLHPDALRNAGTAAGSQQQLNGGVEFAEIAAAWRTLSDTKERRRYDRSLQAEQISEDIANWAGEIFNKAAEEFAIPFFNNNNNNPIKKARTTSAAAATTILRPATTTTTTTSSSSTTYTNNNAPVAEPTNVSKSTEEAVVTNPIPRQQSISKVPTIPTTPTANPQVTALLEKSDALEQLAVAEYRNAMAMQYELQQLARERLRMSLRTAYSGITSSEAALLLQEMDNTILSEQDRNPNIQHHHQRTPFLDPSSWRPVASSLATTAFVEDEIRTLQRLEGTYLEMQQIDTVVQELYRDQIRQREQVQTTLQRAIMEEEEARIQYELAKQRVIEQKQLLQTLSNEVSYAEHQAQKSSYDIERKSLIVEQQSEQVRLALLRHIRTNVKKQQRNRNGKHQLTINDVTTNASNNNMDTDNMYNSNPDTIFTENDFYGINTPFLSTENHHSPIAAISSKENSLLLQQLAMLRQKEQELADLSSRLEIKAAKLLSRANNLRQEAIDSR